MQNEDGEFKEYYDELYEAHKEFLVHKEYVKTKKIMDIVKDRFPRCKKDFKIMLAVSIK